MTAPRPALHFTQLRVHRMPGIRRPGFTLDELCAGINVVHGPNASGKTTTARAIRSLLWPDLRDTPRQAVLGGAFDFADAEWHVELEAGRAAYRCDGREASAPLLAPVENSDRYSLALHELLHDSNAAFAEIILRESAGGYNLAAARDTLGFHDRPTPLQNLPRDLKQARDELREARRKEESLRAELSSLEELKRQRDAARDARHRAAVLELALAWRRAQAQLQSAQQRFDALPGVIEQVVGHEAETLKKLRSRRAEHEQTLRLQDKAIAQARQTITDLKLPEADLPPGLIAALRQNVKTLERHEQDHASEQRQLEGAAKNRAAERRAIGDAVSDDQLATIDVNALGDLTTFAQLAEQYRAERSANEALGHWLGRRPTVEDADQLREAVSLLCRWIDEGRSDLQVDGRGRLAATLGGAAAIAAAAALAWLVYPAWLAAALVGVAAIVLAWWPQGRAVDVRAVHQQAFDRLGVEQPTAWTIQAVQARIDALRNRLAEAAAERELARRWDELADKRAALQEKMEAVETRRAALIERFGVPHDTDAAQLYMLAQRLIRWQDAHARVAEHEAKVAAAERAQAALAKQVSEQLAPLGYPAVTDAAAAHGTVEHLADRIAQHHAARQALTTATDRHSEAGDGIAQTRDDERAVFERLNLAPGDDAALDELCRQRPAYLAAKDALHKARYTLEQAQRQLEAHPQYDPALRQHSAEELDDALRDANALAAQAEALNASILEIELRARDARGKHDVEAALARVARCEAALAEARDSDMDAVVGGALVAFFQEQLSTSQRPRVFRRASELLTQITAGRYKLDFDNSDPPAFRAVDTLTRISHPLEELSSGTRVQLLLAVRVAFVEQHEPHGALPLLLDETLATSDDERARAIIEATIAISRRGRQVFYFTAQHDEVGKWQSLLASCQDVPCRVIDLTEARSLSRRSIEPLSIVRPQRARVPAVVDSISHADYGRQLGVPPLDPMGDVGAAHLWYLIEDPQALHDLLCLNVETWGQLETILAHNGSGLIRDTATQARCLASARALEEIFKLWRVGRGKPVGRAELAGADGVTDTFLDRVVQLAETNAGDARRLIQALTDGELTGWYKRNTAKLRDDLESRGHLDLNPPHTREAIHLRLLSTASDALHRGHLTPERLDWLISAVMQCAEATPTGDEESASVTEDALDAQPAPEH